MEPVVATINSLYCILSGRAGWRVIMLMILIMGDNILRQRLVKSMIMKTCTDFLALQVMLLMPGGTKVACCNTVCDVTGRLFNSSSEVPYCERSLQQGQCVFRMSLRITASRQRTQLIHTRSEMERELSAK